MIRLLNAAPWLIFAATQLASLAGWASARDWQLSKLTAMQVFPLLGLLAFSAMWSHYAIAVLKRRRPNAADYKNYYKWTSHWVLLLIVLHPVLLANAGRKAGFTAFDYVADGTNFLLLGIFGFWVFLVYELVERIKQRPIVQNNLPIIKAFNDAAFWAVFLHGLNLGQHLTSGWLRGLWLVFGLTTLLCFADGWRDLWWRQTNQQRPA